MTLVVAFNVQIFFIPLERKRTLVRVRCLYAMECRKECPWKERQTHWP
ncbi:hypothetical protein WH47_02682 [Habropoda laboriosa]|uniref:Uncharacterized protein n=1 Tax=Habropoda laboriosa TaxID=597456 RepID=A0A0L7QX24_9HYME|nr:hypothetical protein WH47_02682 [Habropoda laboriosa]